MNNSFDAVIIGSGLGGLCCGAMLADSGMKVLVLEQHNKIGGYAHNFCRRGYTFESGIHSVPMSQDSVIMHILRYLKLDKSISTIEHPSMYKIHLPEGSFTMPSRSCEIDDFFKSHASSQPEANLLLKELNRFYNHICMPIIESGNKFLQEDKEFVSKFHNYSYLKHIKSLCSTPEISNLIFGQWPYSGISPESAGALFSFTMFMLHYKEGSHFCKGGFSSLAKVFSDKITSSGGLVLTRKCVNRCIVENGKVKRVKTTDGEVYDTKIVVSNISPYDLHRSLLLPQDQGKLLNRRLNNLNPSISCVIVYLGMNPEFKSISKDCVSFWYESSDYQLIYKKIVSSQKNEPIDHLVILGSIEESDYPTLTLMNFTKAEKSNDWRCDKMFMAEKMLHKLEELYPGINGYINVMEVGSPDTFNRYTSNTGGALYGFENVKDIYGEAKIPITTHIPNLFQTGHWGKPGGGVWNVMVNAFNASKLILNKS